MSGAAPVPVTLRRAGVLDLDTIAALQAAAFPDAVWGARAIGDVMSMPGTFGLIADRDPPRPPTRARPRDPFAVGATDPLGYLVVRVFAPDAEIISFGVVPAAQRRGIGQRLLDAGVAVSRRMGAAALSLEVAVDNEAARAFYHRAGFRTVGRRPGYYRRGGTIVDALVLRWQRPI